MFSGKRNDDENAKEKLYVVATHVPMTEFKVGDTCEASSRQGHNAENAMVFVLQGLTTQTVETEE